jgi:hypothetical protein
MVDAAALVQVQVAPLLFPRGSQAIAELPSSADSDSAVWSSCSLIHEVTHSRQVTPLSAGGRS